MVIFPDWLNSIPQGGGGRRLLDEVRRCLLEGFPSKPMYVVSLISCAQCVVVHTGLYWYRDCEWVAIECGKYFWDTLLGIKEPKIMQKCQIICISFQQSNSYWFQNHDGPRAPPLFCLLGAFIFSSLRSRNLFLGYKYFFLFFPQ